MYTKLFCLCELLDHNIWPMGRSTGVDLNMNNRQRLINELKKADGKAFDTLRKEFKEANNEQMVGFMDWMERTQGKGYAVAILEELGYFVTEAIE